MLPSSLKSHAGFTGLSVCLPLAATCEANRKGAQITLRYQTVEEAAVLPATLASSSKL